MFESHRDDEQRVVFRRAIAREVEGWMRLAPEALAEWRGKLASLRADERAEIID